MPLHVGVVVVVTISVVVVAVVVCEVVGVVVPVDVRDDVGVVVGDVVGVVIWHVANVPSKYEFTIVFKRAAVSLHVFFDVPPRTKPPSWQFSRSSSSSPREYSLTAAFSTPMVELHSPSVVSSVVSPDVMHASVPGSSTSPLHWPVDDRRCI